MKLDAETICEAVKANEVPFLLLGQEIHRGQSARISRRSVVKGIAVSQLDVGLLDAVVRLVSLSPRLRFQPGRLLD